MRAIELVSILIVQTARTLVHLERVIFVVFMHLVMELAGEANVHP